MANQVYKINLKIQNRLKRIKALKDELISLKKEMNLASDYFEMEEKIKIPGQRKSKHVVGYVRYIEDFVDEDECEVVSITRTFLCSIDGVPCNENLKFLHLMEYEELIKYITLN